MQIGVVGLGRMGGNITRRLMKAGHECVVYDANAAAREDTGQGRRRRPATRWTAMVKALAPGRARSG